MLVTPGTRKSHGGTSCPRRSAHGSTQPPMHASTWNRRPRRSVSAAIASTGSITPCAYDGADAATSTTRSPYVSIAAVMATASARLVIGSTGMLTRSTPK